MQRPLSEPAPAPTSPAPTPTLIAITPEPQDDRFFENVSERLDFVRKGVYHGGDGLGGATWLDYDSDGFLDLYIANTKGEDNALFRNNGDRTFTDAAIEAGVAAGDINNDGCTNLFDSGSSPRITVRRTTW